MHPRPNYLRASIDTKDMEVLVEIETLISEALDAMPRGKSITAQVLLETALCNPDPCQGEKYRSWQAGKQYKTEYTYIDGGFYPLDKGIAE